MRGEIREIEKNKSRELMIPSLMKLMKRLFLEKINEINKPLLRLIKKKEKEDKNF